MTVIDRRYSVAEGVAIKAPCRAATTASITLSGLQTIDGIALAEHDRVLVKDQSDATQNGIYEASSGNWSRAKDFDGSFDAVTGTRVFVTSGTSNSSKEYKVTTADPITVGTSSIAFAAAADAILTQAQNAADAASEDAAAAAASAAGVNLPAIISGNERYILQVKKDLSGYELEPSQNVGANVVSILQGVSDAKRTDILAGTNSLDITSDLASLIANVDDGTIIDTTPIRGDWTLTADPFGGIADRNITLLTGRTTIFNDFNSRAFMLPSRLTWRCDGTIIKPTSTITSVVPSNVDTEKGMLRTYVSSTTGSGSFGASTVTVNSTDGLMIGTKIAVLGILTESDLANTLSGDIGSTNTSITLGTSTALTTQTGDGYIQIDDECIHCSMSGTTVTVDERGALGTTAAPHTSGTSVFARLSWTAHITGISGTTITLDDTLPQTFSGATIIFGSVQTSILGHLEIDGLFDQAPGAQQFFFCLGSSLSDRLTVGGRVRLSGGAHGGLLLLATSNAWLDLDSIENCGKPVDELGADIWLFGGCFGTYLKTRIQRGGDVGIAIDDKSSGLTSTGLDNPNSQNVCKLGLLTDIVEGIDISGSFNNTVECEYLSATSSTVSLWKNQGQSTRNLTTNNYVNIRSEGAYAATGGDADLSVNKVVHGSRHEIEGTLTGVSVTVPTGGTSANFTFTGAKAGDHVVSITPSSALNDGVSIGYAYFPSDNGITIGFSNASDSTTVTQDLKILAKRSL